MKRSLFYFLVCLPFLATLSVASAQTVLFTSFDPADPLFSYTTSYGIESEDPAVPDGWMASSLAVKFTPTTSGAVTSVDIVAQILSGSENILFGELWDHDPTELPDGLPDENLGPIDTFDFSGDLPVDTYGIVNASSSSFPSLVAGSMYWFSLYTNGDPTFAQWATNEENVNPLADRESLGDVGDFTEWQIIPNDGIPIATAPAFQINAVPEPSTYALIVGGASLGLVIWMRRRSLKTS